MLKQNNSLNLRNHSNSFKKIFLIEFTKELIKNSVIDIHILEKIVEVPEKKEIKKEDVKKVIKEEYEPSIKLTEIKKIEPELKPKFKPLPKTPTFYVRPRLPTKRILHPPIPRKMSEVLRIPEPPLPARFQYLRPYPTSREVNLGKLNPLIKDPLVRMIECNGSNENIFVRGAMRRKPTSIRLNREEINDIIRKFSEPAKIPLHVGIYRIVLGTLILLAITSEVISSKFIIKKMRYNQQFIGMPPSTSRINQQAAFIKNPTR